MLFIFGYKILQDSVSENLSPPLWKTQSIIQNYLSSGSPGKCRAERVMLATVRCVSLPRDNQALLCLASEVRGDGTSSGCFDLQEAASFIQESKFYNFFFAQYLKMNTWHFFSVFLAV